MTLPESVLIVGLAYTLATVILHTVGWFVVFPWQKRAEARIVEEYEDRRSARLDKWMTEQRRDKNTTLPAKAEKGAGE